MTSIIWQSGTAFDLFVSLTVLHQPTTFGLRPSWAAGVRQRLPVARREFLERVFSFSSVPLPWLSSLPEPMDAGTALQQIPQIEPKKRLVELTLSAETSIDIKNRLEVISQTKRWLPQDLTFLKENFRRGEQPLSHDGVINMMEAWREAGSSGEQLLITLQEYYQDFFEEEEARIRPAIITAMQIARELSERLGLIELIEELSHGVRFAPSEIISTITLVPSYWCSPLIFFNWLKPGELILLFGARPVLESLEPGEGPPQHLIGSLKALADPTRLRILRLISERPLSSSELALLLRLRLPTVIHHLRLLRLEGLVRVTVGESDKKYTCHQETLEKVNESLTRFIVARE